MGICHLLTDCVASAVGERTDRVRRVELQKLIV